MDPSVTLIDLMDSVEEDHLIHFYTPEVALYYCCTWSLMEHFTLVSSYYPRHGLRLRIPCGAPSTQGGGGCSVARLVPRPPLTCSMKGRTEVAPQEEVEEQGVSKAVPSFPVREAASFVVPAVLWKVVKKCLCKVPRVQFLGVLSAWHSV